VKFTLGQFIVRMHDFALEATILVSRWSVTKQEFSDQHDNLANAWGAGSQKIAPMTTR
jgi:hypothetical protein